MRDIKVNGEVRTVYYEPHDRNGKVARLVFADSGLNVEQSDGACPAAGDIQEISGPPLILGPPLNRGYLVERCDGIAKLKSGQEVKVLYCLTPLDSMEDSLISIQRTEKQCLDFCMKQNLKDEEYRKEFERKEAEDRALALEREKAEIALLQVQAQAVKQPAAAPETPMTEHEALACLNISDKTLKRYCRDLGFDAKNLTNSRVENIKTRMAKKRQRLDVALRNKKNSHSKYDGKEGYKER